MPHTSTDTALRPETTAGAQIEAELVALIPHLRRLARHFAPSPDRAEDMAQEALLQVWARLRAGARIDDLRPYLMTVLRHLRARPPGQPAPGNAPATTPLTERNAGTVAGNPTAGLACRDVLAAIGRLPADQRALLRLLCLTRLSYQDLAQHFGLPLGTVMSRLSRARARLRRDLDLPARDSVPALLRPP